MSVEGLGSITGKIPDWETRLWKYIGTGDGMTCPRQSRCRTKIKGGWCPDDNKERLNRLLDESTFHPDNYDFIQSEAKGLCTMCQMLEKLSARYLNDYREISGVSNPPLPTEIVAWIDRQRSIEVRELPLKAYHGAIWYHGNEWVIQLKHADASVTKRFTLFHEAFHILAHCRTTPVFRKRGAVAGSFNEIMADYFASCTTMPREWVIPKWTEIQDLDAMAALFAVPKSAMFIRLRQLGLV